MTRLTTATREALRRIPAFRQIEGEGFEVRRPFPSATCDQVDPFLLLDHMGPNAFAPGEAKGAPTHPHRGFETVTYILEGETEHKDSLGNHGVLGAGDVQWMTAGSGVLHDEMPSRALRERGGTVHGFQLWVNLPADKKMTAPRYQEVPCARIPVGESPDGKVRAKVIAGEALGVRAVIDTHTPISYLHFTLEAGGAHLQPVEATHNVVAYVFAGRGRFGSQGLVAAEGDLVVFAPGGETVQLENDGKQPLELLLLGGEPLREPVARYGPFVMNTREEILQAFQDYEAGRFGSIKLG
jgi:redox-sensitive bicupin YhaK (pirin superfamily)